MTESLNKYIWFLLNPLIASPTKWSNTLKQFVGSLPTNCLSVLDHFVKLAFKGLIEPFVKYLNLGSVRLKQTFCLAAVFALCGNILLGQYVICIERYGNCSSKDYQRVVPSFQKMRKSWLVLPAGKRKCFIGL